jgi:thymidylate synthase
MNSVDKQYFDLIRHIKEHGVEKLDRTGTGTKSVFSYDMRFNMQEGFPLMTSKKMAWKTMVTELLWFLRGDTNIKYLVDNGCHIWNGDAYKNYMTHWAEKLPRIGPCTQEEFIDRIKTDGEFAKTWGELGPIYGKQWRAWRTIDDSEMKIHTYEIDQIANLIKDLKTNPDSRRLMVSAWNPGESDSMVLPPCHYGFQCYTRELSKQERHQLVRQYGLYPKYDFDIIDGKAVPLPITEMEHYDNYHVPKRALSLKFNMRSTDVPLGLPFNIASYGLLLHLLAKEVNMIPDELIFSGGDCHIYLNQMEGITQQLKQQTYKLPTVEIANKSIFDMAYDDIRLLNYQSASIIKMPLSN